MKEEIVLSDRRCDECRQFIPLERIEILPETTLCVKCVSKRTVRIDFDPDEVCAKSSLNTRNGFGSSD